VGPPSECCFQHRPQLFPNNCCVYCSVVDFPLLKVTFLFHSFLYKPNFQVSVEQDSAFTSMVVMGKSQNIHPHVSRLLLGALAHIFTPEHQKSCAMCVYGNLCMHTTVSNHNNSDGSQSEKPNRNYPLLSTRVLTRTAFSSAGTAKQFGRALEVQVAESSVQI
jgi:hypothetical protein